jgi:hypothetical protein
VRTDRHIFIITVPVDLGVTVPVVIDRGRVLWRCGVVGTSVIGVGVGVGIRIRTGVIGVSVGIRTGVIGVNVGVSVGIRTGVIGVSVGIGIGIGIGIGVRIGVRYTQAILFVRTFTTSDFVVGTTRSDHD